MKQILGIKYIFGESRVFDFSSYSEYIFELNTNGAIIILVYLKKVIKNKSKIEER